MNPTQSVDHISTAAAKKHKGRKPRSSPLSLVGFAASSTDQIEEQFLPQAVWIFNS